MSGVVNRVGNLPRKGLKLAEKKVKDFGHRLEEELNPDAPDLPDELTPPEAGGEAPPSLADAEAREAARKRRLELAGRLGFRAGFITGPGGVSENVGVRPILAGG